MSKAKKVEPQVGDRCRFWDNDTATEPEPPADTNPHGLKSGDWAWFWDKDRENAALFEFVKYSEEVTGLHWAGLHWYTPRIGYRNCEPLTRDNCPFLDQLGIGEKPSVDLEQVRALLNVIGNGTGCGVTLGVIQRIIALVENGNR